MLPFLLVSAVALVGDLAACSPSSTAHRAPATSATSSGPGCADYNLDGARNRCPHIAYKPVKGSFHGMKSF